MSVSQRNPYIVEVELKEKLALQCVHAIKVYARQKSARDSVTPVMKRFLAKLVRGNQLDYEFAMLVTVCLSVEYQAIKQQVLSGDIVLEHISYPDYWERVGHHVDVQEAVFFLYTFLHELYPTMSEFFEKTSLKPLKPKELEEKINNHIRTELAQEA